MNHTKNAALVDVLDKVLEKGAVISGDMMIRVADVDLVFVGLRVFLASVSKARELSGETGFDQEREPTPEDIAFMERLQKEIRKAEENIPKLMNADNPRETEQGLARLILAIIELIRKLMEKEAFRRVRSGTIAPVEIQKLGLSLKAVRKKMMEIQAIFGIKDEDLKLNLGPLGDLT